jgi:cation transport ATPase
MVDMGGVAICLFLLATSVQFIAGRQYIVGAYKDLRNKSSNMDTLIAMESLTGYLYSVFILTRLMTGDLAGIGRTISLSKATMRKIYQNLFWAFIYNIVLIPVAMLVAGAMVFSSILIVCNSLTLRKKG